MRRSSLATKDLAAVLRSRGWVDEEALRLAVERQQRLGGTLSTALLEADAISELRLLEALSELHGVPMAGAAELESIPPSVVSMLSSRDASRYRAVPFAVAAGRCDLATDRPDALADLDKLSFMLGKRLAVHVTSEARLAEALDRHYGVARPARLAELLERLAGGRPPAPRSAAAAASEPPPAAAAAAAAVEAVDLPGATAGSSPSRSGSRFRPVVPVVPPDPRRVIELSPAERQAIFGEAAGGASPPAAAVSTAATSIAGARTAKAIGEALLAGLADAFDHVILLRRQRDGFVGWLGRGVGLRQEALEALAIGLEEASVLDELGDGRELVLGGLAPLPAHRRLTATWSGSVAGQFAVLAIRVGGRLLCVVVGNRGLDRQPPLAVDELKGLAAAAARAFAALLADHRSSAG